MLWLAVLGGFDDWLKLTARRRGGGRQGLFAWEKLLCQLGIGLLAGYFAYKQGVAEDDRRDVLNLPFQRTYEGPTKVVNPALVYMGPGRCTLIARLVSRG